MRRRMCGGKWQYWFCGFSGAAFIAPLNRLQTWAFTHCQRTGRRIVSAACRYSGTAAGCRARIKIGRGDLVTRRTFLFIFNYQNASSLGLIMLQANNIHLALNGQAVVTDISLQLHAGEFVGLIGPNGAGKTSLLRMLADLQKADSGDVQLQLSADDIQPISKISAQTRARLLAYLPQQEKPAWP